MNDSDISNPSKDLSEISEWQTRQTTPQVQESGPSLLADSDFSSNHQVNHEDQNSLSFPVTQDDEQQITHEKSELELPHVSFETLDQFSSEKYQQLVTTMISDLSTAVLRESFVAE